MSLFAITSPVSANASCSNCNAPDFTTEACLRHPLTRSEADREICRSIGTVGGTDPTEAQCDTLCTNQYGTKYCANGSSVINTVDGEVMIFGNAGLFYEISVNNVVKASGKIGASNYADTNTFALIGDKIGVAMFYEGREPWIGWRVTDRTQFDSQIENLGYTILIKEAYSDACTGWVDSWDFDDMGLGLAIRPDTYGPYLQTISGNSFIKGKLNMIKYPVNYSPKIYFSTYNYSTAENSEISASIPTNIVSNWLSAKKYLLINYNDSNGRDDYFDYLKSLVGVGAKVYANNSNLTLPDSGFDSYLANNDVININGDLTINNGFVCKNKNIYFVSNNLIINTNINLEGNDSACLFIVKNDTYVSGLVRRVNSFIITKRFTTDTSNVRFDLIGGLITRSNNFFRNIYLNITPNRNIPPEPSEILNYEGARYIKLFGNLLYEPTKVSIREIQYTN